MTIGNDAQTINFTVLVVADGFDLESVIAFELSTASRNLALVGGDPYERCSVKFPTNSPIEARSFKAVGCKTLFRF